MVLFSKEDPEEPIDQGHGVSAPELASEVGSIRSSTQCFISMPCDQRVHQLIQGNQDLPDVSFHRG